MKDSKYVEDRKRLAAKIEKGYWPMIEIGDGWMPLVIELDKKLSEIDPNYTIAQVKEKFGTLRYYADPSNDIRSQYPGFSNPFDDLISDAEQQSSTICEWCGAPGHAAADGRWWLLTLCEDCRKQRLAGATSKAP